MAADTGYTAFLRDLPQDWQTAQISAVARVVGGGTPSRDVPGFWGGDIPWVTPGEVSGEGSAYISETRERITAVGLAGSGATLLPANSLMVTTRATLGARAINAVPMTTNQGFKSLVFESGTDAPFYYYLTDKLRPELKRRASGTTFLEVSGTELARIEVPVPPVRERRLIAEVLDTLDTTIRQTEAIIAKLKQVKHGLLHDLLTRGIDANGELRPPQSQAPHLYKDSPLGWIPREWEVAPLLSRIDLPQGQVDPRRPPYCDWILIAPDHIEPATGRLLAAVTAKAQGAISGKYLCSPGDVIYSKIRPYLRKATMAVGTALCSADMYPFTPHEDVSSQFLLSLLLSEQFSRFAESVSMRTGMPKINRDELAESLVGWPSRNEQDAVVAVLSAADRKQDIAIVEREKLVRLKSGLMDDLLTGRVRVTPLLRAASA